MTHTVTLKEWPEPGVTIKSGVIIDANTGDQVLSLMPKYKVMSECIIESCNNYAALKKSHAELLALAREAYPDGVVSASFFNRAEKAISAAESLDKGA